MTRARPVLIYVVLAGVGCAVPLLGASTLMLTQLTQAVISALLATAVGMMVRQNGLISFGHAAFFGLSAYVLALVAAHEVLPMEASIPLALLTMAALAYGTGLLFLRLSGVAFSMMTLALAQGFYEIFLRWRALGNGEDGLRIDLPDELFGLNSMVFQRPGSMFPICWAVLMLVLCGLTLLARSHFGTLTIAIRENEERVRFIGYRTERPRAIVYAISAAIAAAAGALFALYNGFVTPESLHWSLSGEVLIMAIIGGTRQVWGPAVGAVLFFFLKSMLGDVTEHWQAVMGSTLIVAVVLLPNGIGGLVTRLLQSPRRVWRQA